MNNIEFSALVPQRQQHSRQVYWVILRNDLRFAKYLAFIKRANIHWVFETKPNNGLKLFYFILNDDKKQCRRVKDRER